MKPWFPALVALAACKPTPSTDIDLDAVLTARDGCDDAVFFAMTPESSVILIAQVPGIASGALAAGGDIEFTWEIPDDQHILVELAFGTSVGELICGGDDSQTGVDYAFLATSGGAHVTAAPAGDGTVDGTLELTDVTLVSENPDDGAAPQLIPSMIIPATGLAPVAQ
jgi:hypothetical protein